MTRNPSEHNGELASGQTAFKIFLETNKKTQKQVENGVGMSSTSLLC